MERSFVHCMLLLVWVISAVHGQNCTNTKPTNLPTLCSPIEPSLLERCANFYTYSFFPNNVSRTAEEALQGFERYSVFTEFGCSVYAEVYICLALAPHCNTSLPRPRPPCASFCDNVKAQCNDDVNSRGGFGFDVYCLLQCDRYPDSDATGSNCVTMDDPLVVSSISMRPPKPDPTTTLPSNESATFPLPSATCFSGSAKQFALGWVAFWSVLCFISTGLTIFTSLLDTS